MNFEKYLEIIKENRIPAIYNYEYTFYDSEMQQYDYGNTRADYEKFKSETPHGYYIEHDSGTLRTVKSNQGDILGYVVEKKLETNSSWDIMSKAYQDAYNEFKEELGIKKHDEFDYYFSRIQSHPMNTNDFQFAIRNLQEELNSFYEDEEYSEFIKMFQ
jgi:hypothetical protein